MAFHFNWSPLIADTDRVRQMLTSSLNKSPKPPIIVDDILVNELNLGRTPPSLEILEVGDLAEDRFRGIFKVRYEGDAYLTLKTRVQANPLNTFLSTKPTFASPNPLAAGSGLTIPLQITLSDIRLSGFVILVFSKQKGITLVFRNDPLESLKVSSTFDSIPFVRDYLQKTIEGQLRVLFMEDLPAIIHRLSLRVFDSEGRSIGPSGDREKTDDFLAASDIPSPTTHDPSAPSTMDDSSSAEPVFPFDIPTEMYATFSQKNLLRLATLSESQRTLSLFTPPIRDAVFRARACAAERDELNEDHATPLQRPTTLSALQSTLGISTISGLSSASSFASEAPSYLSRPSITSLPSVSTTYSLGSGSRRSHPTRKRKNRVVNLRRHRDGATDGASDGVSISSGYEDSVSRSESASAYGSTAPVSAEDSTVPTSAPATSVHPKEREGEVDTPHVSPKKKRDLERAHSTLDRVISSADGPAALRPSTPQYLTNPQGLDEDDTPRASIYVTTERKQDRVPAATTPSEAARLSPLPRSASELSISDLVSAFPMHGSSSGGILEQAWMMKMANEIAKRVAEEKHRHGAKWQQPDASGHGDAPPAYVS